MLQRGRGLAVEKRQAPAIEIAMAGMTPPPRSKEGTHPGRFSHVRNTETPTESGSLRRPGRSIVRAAELSGGNRMPNKRMPVGESRQENHNDRGHSSKWCCWITGRIPGHECPG